MMVYLVPNSVNCSRMLSWQWFRDAFACIEKKSVLMVGAGHLFRDDTGSNWVCKTKYTGQSGFTSMYFLHIFFSCHMARLSDHFFSMRLCQNKSQNNNGDDSKENLSAVSYYTHICVIRICMIHLTLMFFVCLCFFVTGKGRAVWRDILLLWWKLRWPWNVSFCRRLVEELCVTDWLLD